MEKKKRNILIAVVLIALILIGFFALTRSSEIKIMLIPESGVVEVDSGKGYVKISGETILDGDETIRTQTNSVAIVILHESVLITLEENTEISIESLVKDNIIVKQNKGSTWNKFTRLNGVNNYNVKTPTSVAAVKGTEFGLEENQILVASGKVSFIKNEQEIIVGDLEKAGFVNNGLKKLPLTPEDKKKIIENMKRQINYLKLLREKELEKNKILVATLEKTIGKGYTSDEFFQKVDQGEINIEEAIAKSPVPLPFESVTKVKNLSLKIKKQLQDITRIEGY